jgi:hypothetical protein
MKLRAIGEGVQCNEDKLGKRRLGKKLIIGKGAKLNKSVIKKTPPLRF